MSFNTTIGYQVPTEIRFGLGIVEQLPEVIEAYSKKILLVSMRDIPALNRIRHLLESSGAEVTLFDQVLPNPYDSTIDEAAEAAKEKGCGLVVGLGGGSAIDTAKAAAVMATHEGKAWDYTVEMGKNKHPIVQEILPVIAIPTTAGTGAEVTMNAILTNPVTKQKSPVQSHKICPTCALVDPELTVTMPGTLTAATGFDAFCHAFERFLCAESFPFIGSMAAEAMRTAVENLRVVLDDPSDIEARCAMSWAATQAGLSLLVMNMGESGLHVFSLPLSAHFEISHGEALTVVMPFVLPELSKIRPEKVARLAKILLAKPERAEGLSIEHACETAIEEMNRWLAEIKLNRKLSDYGIEEVDLEKIASSISMPRITRAWEREMDHEEIRSYYRTNL